MQSRQLGKFFGLLLAIQSSTSNSSTGIKNLVYIIVDDLRPEISAYNLNHPIKTPNLDKLAAESLIFDRAYAQFALCGPSRSSFMTGRRPDTTGVWNLDDSFRTNGIGMNWTTLPGMFLNAGFQTLGTGKTFHPQQPRLYDSNRSWSPEALPYYNPCFDEGIDCFPCPKTGWGIGNVSSDWCMIESRMDNKTVSRAVTLLNSAIASQQSGGEDAKPFFLSIGMHKPHMPWQAKKKFFDMYPLENISVAVHKTAPTNMPDIAWTNDDSSPSPWEPIEDDGAKLARRAYYAAVSGMDEHLGIFLDNLAASPVAESTAILLHGDHGWQLGEHCEWKKNTNFDLAVRVPLMLKVPWLPAKMGTRTPALVELVDVMPTLAELSGVAMPEDETFDGVSLLPLLETSAKAESISVKNASFSQYPRAPKNPDELWADNKINHADPTKFKYMGMSIRTGNWRYTAWYTWDNSSLAPAWGGESEGNPPFVELYDHRGENTTFADFDGYENENVAGFPEYADIEAQLLLSIRQQFKDPTLSGDWNPSSS